MAELADALDLGSNAQKACRFKSCSRHHSPKFTLHELAPSLRLGHPDFELR
jgi:hypothetical protein